MQVSAPVCGTLAGVDALPSVPRTKAGIGGTGGGGERTAGLGGGERQREGSCERVRLSGRDGALDASASTRGGLPVEASRRASWESVLLARRRRAGKAGGEGSGVGTRTGDGSGGGGEGQGANDMGDSSPRPYLNPSRWRWPDLITVSPSPPRLHLHPHHVPARRRRPLPPPCPRPSFPTLVPQPECTSAAPHHDLLCRLGAPTVLRLLPIRRHHLCLCPPRQELPARLGLGTGPRPPRKTRSRRTRQFNQRLAQHRWLDRKQASLFSSCHSHPSPLLGSFQTQSHPPKTGTSLPTTSVTSTTATILTASTSTGSTRVKLHSPETAKVPQTPPTCSSSSNSFDKSCLHAP